MAMTGHGAAIIGVAFVPFPSHLFRLLCGLLSLLTTAYVLQQDFLHAFRRTRDHAIQNLSTPLPNVSLEALLPSGHHKIANGVGMFTWFFDHRLISIRRKTLMVIPVKRS